MFLFETFVSSRFWHDGKDRTGKSRLCGADVVSCAFDGAIGVFIIVGANPLVFGGTRQTIEGPSAKALPCVHPRTILPVVSANSSQYRL